MAAEPRHRARGFVEVGVEEIAPVLDIESDRKLGRADKITEHHRDRASLDGIELGEGLRRRGAGGQRRSGLSRKRFGCGKLRYGFEEPSTVAEGYSEFFEVSIGEIPEHIEIDPVVLEPLLVSAEPETMQPHAYIHDRALAPSDIPLTLE